MVQVNILVPLISFFLFSSINALKFCFRSDDLTPSKPIITISQFKPSNEIRIKQQSDFRSYHPHYLSSFSYPRPHTPHFYFGEVVGITPFIQMKNLNNWDPNSIQKFIVNGIQYKDGSSKYYKHNVQPTLRNMLILQIQNSYSQLKSQSMSIFRRKDHFLILCQTQNILDIYSLYLTKNQSILNLNIEDLKGINIYIRNQSLGDSRNNWKFSQGLYWKGNDDTFNSKQNKVKGLVIQIQFKDSQLSKQVKINLLELANPNGLNLQQFAKKEESIELKMYTPSKQKIVIKNNNCANAAAQKVLEGLSYEYGTLRIKDGSTYLPNNPQSLLSFSPSRKRFPWGFLWDDGFHCEVAVRRDQKLTYKVIKSWLESMLQNGWIPRQQNRGAQRQQLCSCPRFMQKDIKDGNPPTLILALEYLKRKDKLSNDAFPIKYWQKIKKWYNWFFQTQKDEKQFMFKWRDSINQWGASFTSGMDDFPRPYMTKAHVDLHAWLYFFTDFMIQAAPVYNENINKYTENLQLLKNSFEKLIENSTSVYKDLAIDGTFSQHFGYPNILPIAFGVPKYESKEYNFTIAMIKEHLDIGAGLSSISRHSRLYLENENAYWKGPVWLNINYLFLRGLKLYYPGENKFYKKVRNDLLKAVCGNWENTGYFFQNYIQGRGSFSFPFNGWTSLISIIDQENY